MDRFIKLCPFIISYVLESILYRKTWELKQQHDKILFKFHLYFSHNYTLITILIKNELLFHIQIKPDI